MNLSHIASSSFLSFLVFGKEIISYLLLLFLNLRAQGDLSNCLLSLFILRARGALYRLDIFYNTAFTRPWIDTAYIIVYNYVI